MVTSVGSFKSFLVVLLITGVVFGGVFVFLVVFLVLGGVIDNRCGATSISRWKRG